jgi:hypothetical protein
MEKRKCQGDSTLLCSTCGYMKVTFYPGPTDPIVEVEQ